jgi:hypothetical protein
MVEREQVGRLRRLGRFVTNANLFETETTDERTIHLQRWSTHVYICVLLITMYILIVESAFYVEIGQIEVQNPSQESYVRLQNRYSDVNCPCSQISSSYRALVTLTPIYHPICSSGFISQTWIEMLFDNMTAFRFPGDFRATASIQFQVLRELCNMSQTALNIDIQSFYDREFISGALLYENRWRVETRAIIDAFHNSSFTNIKHRISFLPLVGNFQPAVLWNSNTHVVTT